MIKWKVESAKCKVSGFTLIELLVAISILAILMTIAIISYLDLQRNSRDQRRKTDFGNIQSALEQYHADLGFYPSALSSGSLNNCTSLSNCTITKTYMTNIPLSLQNINYEYFPLPPNCNNSTVKCIDYCLKTETENSVNNTSTLPIKCSGSTYINRYVVSSP